VTSRRRLGRALAAPLLLALLAACNPSISPTQERPVDASKVTEARLDPCPAAGKPVSGGLPQVSLPCLDGKERVDLAGLKGPMLVNVWYSTCPPCKDEAHLVEQFRTSAKGKVQVLGVDVEPQPNSGLDFAINLGLHYPSVSDQHIEAQSKLGVQGFPSTYFLDATGHLVDPPQIGQFHSLAEIKAAVKAHLGVTVP
jgi:cytochrome c biogenesis protein CcmG/thiol:disulfide interchange protein DsbE